jgi:U3 small nucleolar RNA-associated protein 19
VDGDNDNDDEDPAPKRKRRKKSRVRQSKEISNLKKSFEKAWSACMQLPLRPSTYKQVLLRLPENIMPLMRSPLKLADFLTDSYNLGGLSSILALSGLFILMRVHNLDYPNFYAALYRTLTPAVFYAKHRARFFRLLTVCLAAKALPAATAASFIKRLNRLALGAPPSGALYALALTKNLLLRHPECMVLIRRDAGGGEGPTGAAGGSRAGSGGAAASAYLDRFLPTEADPAAAQSLESSLWELYGSRAHYHPAVAALAKDMERKWDKHEAKLPMDEYTAHTYRELFELEASRKVKTTPLCFKRPDSLFVDDDMHKGIFSIGV